MNCPACGDTRLTLAERQGVEIDYCPDCRGVWLDRGELDKIIDRVAGAPLPERWHPRAGGERQDDRERDRDDGRSGGQRRKRESFLGDLFDFGG